MSEKKQQEERFASAGWLFFCIAFAILAVPGIFLARRITYEETPWIGILGTGLVLAAVAGGLITWAVNSTLHYRAERHRAASRKKGKKK